MENVILIIHLILAFCLIGVVLLQRSEGGGLGMGSSGGLVSARGAATALGKLTWIFAIAFIGTSIALTIISARNAASTSVTDAIAPASAPQTQPAEQPTGQPASPEIPAAKDLLPPGSGETAPAPQPRAD